MPKSIVQQQFGPNAAAYAASNVHAKGASLGRLVELVRPERHWRGLDIATGAGHTAAAFAPYVAEMIATDITPEMLDQARKLAAERQLSTMVTAEADAEALPFADSSFELVACRLAPHHFPNVARFVEEVSRVLRPGGTFALVDNVSPSEATTPGFDPGELEDAAVTYNAFEKMRDPSHMRALTTPEWEALITEAGFRTIHHEHLSKRMDFQSWCKNMATSPDTACALEAMLDAASPALAAFLAPSREGGSLSFMLTELILIGRKER